MKEKVQFKMLKKIFNYQKFEDKSCLTILGIKIKWINKTRILQELLMDIKKQNSSLQDTLNDVQNKIKSSVDCVSTEMVIKNLKEELKESLNAAKNEIKSNNTVDFLYDNFKNPKYGYIYNDLYKIFTAGEYYSMDSVYTQRINKYTIDKNLEKIKDKYSKIYLLTDLEENFELASVIDVDCIKNIKEEINSIFVLAYNQDYLAISAIKELNKNNFKYLSLEQYGTPQARYYHINQNVYDTLKEESLNKPLNHFCPGDFENILQAIDATKKLEGDYVEIGTFQGASARATLNYLNRTGINRKCYFVDTYEGFTYEEAQNTYDVIWTNTHTNTSIDGVREYLSQYNNFELVKSNIIQNELPDNIEKICVANIDVDMYEAVKAALYKVKDRIVKNGIIIAEDYGHTPALIGAQKATDEFLEENPDEFIPIYLHSGQLFLIKK